MVGNGVGADTGTPAAGAIIMAGATAWKGPSNSFCTASSDIALLKARKSTCAYGNTMQRPVSIVPEVRARITMKSCSIRNTDWITSSFPVTVMSETLSRFSTPMRLTICSHPASSMTSVPFAIAFRGSNRQL